MIELKNVTKTFETKDGAVQALKDVNLRVEKGEIFGVIGYSGAGKSTLIRCVNLLERPTSGQVFVNDEELSAVSPKKLKHARRKIGMIFQHFNLLKTVTVYDNIAIPLKLTGLPKAEIDTRVNKYLSIVGLQDRKSAYPAQLSGGQKQRVAIARALAHEPDVLLSDEATSALDPDTTEAILELLLKINRELGITILLITHEMNVIQRICDRVAVMENGEVIESGSVVDTFSKPVHHTTQKFVNSAFDHQIPTELLQQLEKDGPIVQLSFVGTSSGEPALAVISKKFNIYPNIIGGSILQLKHEPYGQLLVHLQGTTDETKRAIDWLNENQVSVSEVKPNDKQSKRVS
ncbi:methionine ABC transporter ATP-binding protein [Bacillus tianshenii]|nr:methionine ABC transporter ATP-binding protein [Bacillus tianshenii]